MLLLLRIRTLAGGGGGVAAAVTQQGLELSKKYLTLPNYGISQQQQTEQIAKNQKRILVCPT